MDVIKKLDELHYNGVKIYSFSKLGSFHNCEYEYYNTYITRKERIDNVYTIMGSLIHSNLEAIYRGNGNFNSFKDNYINKLLELDILDLHFPSESIGQSWKSDVDHFINHFNKLNNKFVLEKQIVFEIVPGIWMQGFVDAISPSDKGKPYVNIIDWKTSSKFTGKKLKEAGRQLLMYKLGIEATTDYKVDKIMWFMIKYIYVCTMQKNGKVKKKMCNRGKWVKEIKDQVERELYKTGMDEFEVELLLDHAIHENSLLGLPQQVQEKFWLEDCFVEYDATEENITELKEYVTDTVNQINSKNKEDESDWNPVDITQKNSFYCSVLCGHRKHCQYYKAFIDENKDSFDKKAKNDSFDLFG